MADEPDGADVTNVRSCVRIWQILLQKALMASAKSDSSRRCDSLRRRAMMGAAQPRPGTAILSIHSVLMRRCRTIIWARRARSSPRPAKWSMTGKHFERTQERFDIKPERPPARYGLPR